MSEKRLSHAYMLIGPEGAERDEKISELTSSLLCSSPEPPCGSCRDCRKVREHSHPDVIYVVREKGDNGTLRAIVAIDQIRAMTADAAIAPNEAIRKVYIIPEADRMNVPSQNALLKSLEDPPGHSCFILCSVSEEALLPTVRSRCVRVDVSPKVSACPPLSELAAGYLAAAASGSQLRVMQYCMLRTTLDRTDTEQLLEELTAALGDMLCFARKADGLSRERITKLLTLTEKMKDHLRRNVSPKQLFGVMAVETLR